MRRTVLAFCVLAIITSAILPIFVMQHSYASEFTTSYATIGAYAEYEGNGGYVSFLGGVSSNITYSVTNVYPNNTMVVFVNATISMGSESGVPPTNILKNFSDSVLSPTILPAVSPRNLTEQQIFFQNTTCKFVKNSMVNVPAGTFNATEFQGTDANGTTVTFWFDRSTGLAIQMSQAISYLQLIQSNIAPPVRTQTSVQAELPFIIVFVVGWSLIGVAFYAVWRHYSQKAKRDFGGKKKRKKAKVPDDVKAFATIKIVDDAGRN